MRLVHDDLVVLDVGGDSYSCLAEAAADVQILGSGRIRCSDDLAEAFAAEGWLADPLTRLEAVRAPGPLPVRRLQSSQPHRPRAVTMLRLMVSWRATRVRSRLPFARQLEWAARRPVGRPASAQAELAQCVSDFRNTMILLPEVRECLFQSQLLLEFLRHHGLDADWVFGVRTWPFAAHCWLQVGDAALVDDPEGLVAYHPILVV